MEVRETASLSSGTISDALESLAGILRRSTVAVTDGRRGSGSGVIWRPDGLIVTNAHVVRGSTATVELWDGQELAADVLARNDRRDLAALRVDATDLPATRIGDSSRLKVGQLVFAMGNPHGVRSSLTMGVVHAIGREGRWVQADVQLLPGNSGGPLTDAAGSVIGINSMVSGRLGLAVPSAAVTAFLGAAGGRPRLGIVSQPVVIPSQERSGAGLLLLEITAGSPAEQAGLIVGDILTGVAGRAFTGPQGLIEALDSGTPMLHLDIMRGGTRISRDVVLGNQDRSVQAAA
jgi:serine protease Do